MSQLRPKEMTSALGISAATLRLWSNNFAPVLSPAAQKARTETGGAAQRRYTEQDLRIFTKAKELLGQGKTYEETLEVLRDINPAELILSATPTQSTTQNALHDVTGAVAVEGEHPVMLAFREALAAKDQTIALLTKQLEEKRAPVVFRWRFLNWLLKP